MWKKTKMILLSSALTFSLTCGSTNFVALAENNVGSGVKENITLNYLKIKYENKVLFHEQVPQKTIIQVLNTNGEVLDSEVLTGDKETELAAPKIPKGKMLSYWGVFRQKDKITIDPMLIDAKELTVKFSTTEGGELLENNAQTKVIVKSVNKGANLKDVLPEVSPKNHYKLTGWFTATAGQEEKLKEIDDMKILDSKGEYYAKFYPDFNDNGIDDRTEEITLKFVTNSYENFKDIKTQVGKQLKLPVLKNKDSVFMGWYTDEEFKNKVTDNFFTESQTLYAKWEKAEKVIKEAQTKPITDKDVSDQVEEILKESVTQKPIQPLSKGDGGANNPVIAEVNKNQNQINEPGVAPQSNTFKETKYVFTNKNIGEQYMVKFFDENEIFLFSLTLPYGKTIKTYDEDDRFHDEYAVRQDTTITLNTKEYIHEDSFLLGFKTREVKVNSTQITEVYPDIKSNVNTAANEPYDYQKELEGKQKELEEKNEAKMKNIIIYSLVTVALVIFSGVGIYLFKKRKKRALLDTI